MNENQNERKISKDTFEKIFKAIPNPIYIWKKVENDLILIDYNRAAEDITEGKIKNLLSIKASEFHKQQPEILEDLNRSLNEKITISREMDYIFNITKMIKKLYVIYEFIPPDLVLVHTEDVTERKRAKEKLTESEKKYRLISENVNDVICIFDSEGRFLYCNDASEKLLGYTPQELIGTIGFDHVHPEDLNNTYQDLERALQTGLVENEARLRIKNGLYKWFEYRAQAIYDEKNIAQKIIGIFRDITERKEAEQKLKESEKKYRFISENANDLIYIINSEGRFIYCNDASEKLLGFTPQELIGTIGFDLVHPEDLNKIYQDVEKALQTGLVENEVRLRTKNGSYKWLEYRGRSIYDEKNITQKIIGIFRDITERKKIEHRIVKSEKKYREAYNRAEFYKDLFAHDMNNILQAIMSSNDIISNCLKNAKNINTMKKMVIKINNHIERGTSLIENVQKLSQLEKIQILMKQTEVISILNQLQELIIENSHDKNITIDIDNPLGKIHVFANELLRDIFENILYNAIKHNDNPKVEILIKISREQKGGINYCKIEFMDNGRGIPDGMKEKIFQRGYSEEKSIRGMGLGLSLVKKIIDNYNGQIWVEDRVQGAPSLGSNFVLLIPEGE